MEKIKQALLLSFVFFLVPVSTQARGHFDFTPSIEKAYTRTISLRLIESQNLLNQVKESDPDNLLVLLIEDYNDFFTIFIEEEYPVYKQKIKNKENRLRRIKTGNPQSPYYLYAQADIRLHWALLALRFEDYYKAFTEVNKAFKLLKENIKRFPDFMPNYKDIGILHATVGTIPDNYKTGVELFTSLEGTIEQGTNEIQKVLTYAENHDFPFENETRMLYAFLMLDFGNDADNAWEIITAGDLDPEINPLSCYAIATVAMRSGHNEKAIELLTNRPKSRAFLHMPFMDFMLGLTKLRRLDTDVAPHFRDFLTKFKGQHYIKETYQKLAWGELINGNTTAYLKYMEACLHHGNAHFGGDKSAQKEALEQTAPHPQLLKARLLFDGAYYDKALKVLNTIKTNSFKNQKSILEYSYRKGRILHGLKRYDEAIRSYRETIQKGRDKSYYFACNAALKSGEIYEAQHQYSKSKKAYEECLSIHPDEYKSGLHQQAKAGLNRLQGK